MQQLERGGAARRAGALVVAIAATVVWVASCGSEDEAAAPHHLHRHRIS